MARQGIVSHCRLFAFQGRSEGVEEGPVGFAGVEQGPDSVVGEVGESEGGAFDAFDQVVEPSRKRGEVGGCWFLSGGLDAVVVRSLGFMWETCR